MLPLLIDENLNHQILRGLRLRLPALDYIVAQNATLRGAADETVLEWAAEHGRILVTHDVNTVPRHAYDRVRADQPMPGVVLVPGNLGVGLAISELATLIECSTTAECVNQVFYLPI
ncbi:MAG: hypothetical protein GEV06_07065 [Luteitalea sp.]|nr:hypothetical protein [Luteitalea sp.]